MNYKYLIKGLLLSIMAIAFIASFATASLAVDNYSWVVNATSGQITGGNNLRYVAYYQGIDNYIQTEDTWNSTVAYPNSNLGYTYPAGAPSKGFITLNSTYQPNPDPASTDTLDFWVSSIADAQTGHGSGVIGTFTPTWLPSGNSNAVPMPLSASLYLAEPGDFRGYANSTSAVVMWNAVAGANQYRIYRGSNTDFGGETGIGAGLYKKVGSSEILSYKDTAVSVGNTYYYTVVPVDASGSVINKMGVHTNQLALTPTAGTDPNITNVTPNPTPVGTSITITGTNLGTGGIIEFNGNRVIYPGSVEVTSWVAGSITVTIPAGVTTGSLYVVTGGRISNTYTLTIGSATAPTITSVTPTFEFTSGLPRNVTIEGTNLGAATAVSLGGTSITNYTIISATRITVEVAASFTPGTRDFVVTNASGTNANTAADNFTVVGIPAMTANVSPNTGPSNASTPITITGSSFLGATAFTIDGTPLTGVLVVNDNTITANVPSGQTVGAHRIIVTGPMGTSADTAYDDFTVTAANVAPNNPNPATLFQYRTDGTTLIANGGWTNQTSVILRATMSDSNNPDTLVPSFEVRLNASAFTNIPTNNGAPVAYAGTPVVGSATVAGLVSGSTYKWQAKIMDAAGASSSWVQYNTTTPNFRVDTVAPVMGSHVPATGATNVSTSAAITITFTETLSGLDNATLIPANFTVNGVTSGSHNISAVNINGNTVTLVYDPAFSTFEVVTVGVLAGVRDIAGNSVTPANFTFTTGAGGGGNFVYERAGGIMMAYPNPFDPTDTANPLKMLFGAATGEAVDIYILDSNGRVIWQEKDSTLAADRTVIWDGDTAYGERVENGLYLIRVVQGTKVVAKGKILVIKKK